VPRKLEVQKGGPEEKKMVIEGGTKKGASSATGKKGNYRGKHPHKLEQKRQSSPNATRIKAGTPDKNRRPRKSR